MDAKDEGEAGRRMNWGDWCGEVGAMPMSDVDSPVALGGIHEGDWGGEAGVAPRTDVLADEGGRRCCEKLEGLWEAADRRRPCGEILCPWGWYGPTPMPAPPCSSSCARVGRAAEGRAEEEEEEESIHQASQRRCTWGLLLEGRLSATARKRQSGGGLGTWSTCPIRKEWLGRLWVDRARIIES